MILSLVLTGIFQKLDISFGVLIMILVFILCFQTTTGPIGFLYTAEITTDAGFGICISVLMGMNLLIGLTTEPLFNSILPQKVFWLFAIF